MDFAVNVIRFFCCNTPIVKGKLEEGGNGSDEEWEEVVSHHLNQNCKNQITETAPCENIACRVDRKYNKD